VFPLCPWVEVHAVHCSGRWMPLVNWACEVETAGWNEA